ncbi:anthrone oxygenase family protein [Streptomyces sp. NPDC055287]
MATLLIALAIVATGLYAGFMLIFLTGIMPALGRLTDEQFVAAMRRINEEVPRGVFVSVMLASVAFPAAALAVPGDDRSGTQWVLLGAGLVLVVLNHVVTVAGNIPLNNALAASEQTGTEQTGTGKARAGQPGAGQSAAADREARAAFETRWNRLHLVRTLLVTAGFALVVSAALA